MDIGSIIISNLGNSVHDGDFDLSYSRWLTSRISRIKKAAEKSLAKGDLESSWLDTALDLSICISSLSDKPSETTWNWHFQIYDISKTLGVNKNSAELKEFESMSDEEISREVLRITDKLLIEMSPEKTILTLINYEICVSQLFARSTAKILASR